MFITPITGLRRQPSKMSIRQTLALLAGLAALKALPAAGEEYRTLARLTDLFKRDPSRAAALVATAREGSRAINQSDAQRSPNLPGGSNLPALVDGVLVYDGRDPSHAKSASASLMPATTSRERRSRCAVAAAASGRAQPAFAWRDFGGC